MAYQCFIVVRAIFVRFLFASHGLLSIWRLYTVTKDPYSWMISLGLCGLVGEAAITLWRKEGNEWKWFCPSVLFYLLSIVPAIWFLEMHELERRISLKFGQNVTDFFDIFMQNDTEGLSANLAGIGLEIKIPLSSDQWLRALEQLLLLFLILGRWLLPKGKLTHDQLSQLLLVYIGTAADIVEFFDAFKEEEVRYNRVLCKTILAIWSWSLLQFTMVLTATKARKDQSGLMPVNGATKRRKKLASCAETCCTPDVYGIIISIFMQDAPFLVLRMLLIFKYGVLSYTNMFFTCKNTLVIALLMYRLIVIQLERRNAVNLENTYMSSLSESNSRMRLMPHSTSTDQYYNYKTKVELKEHSLRDAFEHEPTINYVIKRHFSTNNMRQLTLNDLDELADLTRKPKTDSEIEEILGVDKEVNTDNSIISDDRPGEETESVTFTL